MKETKRKNGTKETKRKKRKERKKERNKANEMKWKEKEIILRKETKVKKQNK
jgi:hypothetical protein